MSPGSLSQNSVIPSLTLSLTLSLPPTTASAKGPCFCLPRRLLSTNCVSGPRMAENRTKMCQSALHDRDQNTLPEQLRGGKVYFEITV